MNSSCRDTIAVADSAANTELSHYRLSHMSEKGTKVLRCKAKLSGLKTVDHSLCEACIFGKQKRVSFSKMGREPKSRKLELVHTDVWGPACNTRLFYVTDHIKLVTLLRNVINK